MPMSQYEKNVFLAELAEFIADKGVTSIQLFMETAEDVNYAFQCAPSDIFPNQPLDRVFH